ncbi:MAG: UPF0175 family protein [Nanoarchaeota archaeon]
MQKTLSVRMDEENYEFVRRMAKENKEDVSKAVREMVDLGRLMFAIESYKEGKASVGKAAELAGVSISQMIGLLSKYGIEGNLEYEDYLKGFDNLKKAW